MFTCDVCGLPQTASQYCLTVGRTHRTFSSDYVPVPSVLPIPKAA